MSSYLSPDEGTAWEIRGRSRDRQSHHIVPSLHASPYLSSPIRPITESRRSRSRGSVSTRRSKGGYQSGYSTSHSLQVTSPYSESFIRRKPRLRTPPRSVLLPTEIDSLVRSFESSSGKFRVPCIDVYLAKSKEDKANGETKIDDGCNNTFLDSDEESTVTSHDAMSFDDDIINKKLRTLKEEENDILFTVLSSQPKQDINKENLKTTQSSPEIRSCEPEKAEKKIDVETDKSSQEQFNEIKLPPVKQEDRSIRTRLQKKRRGKVKERENEPIKVGKEIKAKCGTGEHQLASFDCVGKIRSTGEPYMVKTSARRIKVKRLERNLRNKRTS